MNIDDSIEHFRRMNSKVTKIYLTQERLDSMLEGVELYPCASGNKQEYRGIPFVIVDAEDEGMDVEIYFPSEDIVIDRPVDL